jgi:hypothetical protein
MASQMSVVAGRYHGISGKYIFFSLKIIRVSLIGNFILANPLSSGPKMKLTQPGFQKRGMRKVKKKD